ncbi:MAG: hypothetical protein J6R32_08555 [Bacteroidales bacterium]|nr:hypothetical protein [Bacteroidales bacterium]
MNELATIISNAGSTVVLIAYLIYRDKVFISRLSDTLTKVETYLKVMTEREVKTNVKKNDESFIHDLISDREVI